MELGFVNSSLNLARPYLKPNLPLRSLYSLLVPHQLCVEPLDQMRFLQSRRGQLPDLCALFHLSCVSGFPLGTRGGGVEIKNRSGF